MDMFERMGFYKVQFLISECLLVGLNMLFLTLYTLSVPYPKQHSTPGPDEQNRAPVHITLCECLYTYSFDIMKGCTVCEF